MFKWFEIAWKCRVLLALVFAYSLGFQAGHGGKGLSLPPVAAPPISVPAPGGGSSGGPPQGPSAPIVMAARPLFPDVPAGGYPHSVYTWGNCTWWAAYNRRVPAWAPNGDAWQWYGNASRDGIPTSAEPSVGAIVVYRAGRSYSAHGHVAIVVALGVAVFRVSEMNYDGLNVVDERDDVWPNANVEGFIPR